MKPKVPLEDRVEIEERIARYCWALDQGDFEGYADCFTEDGWLDHWPQGKCVGREGLKRATDSLWYGKPDAYLGRQHRIANVIMTPEGDDVRIAAHWSILQHNVNTFENRVFGLGTWDTLASQCAGGEWRFKSVEVGIWVKGRVPWKGEARAWVEGAGIAPLPSPLQGRGSEACSEGASGARRGGCGAAPSPNPLP